MRFSIRDLLWLTVVVALGVGWWLDDRRQSVSKREFEFFRTRFFEQQRELHHYYKGGTPDSFFRPVTKATPAR
jgi:hypothetical protein